MEAPGLTGRVRAVFLAVGVLFVAQGVFTCYRGEPYPALAMPGFRGDRGLREGRIAVWRFEAAFVSEGNEVVVPSKLLLREFPNSHHSDIAWTALRPRSDRPTRGASVSRPAWNGDLPDDASSDDRRPASGDESLRDWLRGRAAALAPGRPISRVEIRWYQLMGRVEQGKLVTERKPHRTRVIPLEGDSP